MSAREKPLDELDIVLLLEWAKLKPAQKPAALEYLRRLESAGRPA